MPRRDTPKNLATRTLMTRARRKPLRVALLGLVRGLVLAFVTIAALSSPLRADTNAGSVRIVNLYRGADGKGVAVDVYLGKGVPGTTPTVTLPFGQLSCPTETGKEPLVRFGHAATSGARHAGLRNRRAGNRALAPATPDAQARRSPWFENGVAADLPYTHPSLASPLWLDGRAACRALIRSSVPRFGSAFRGRGA